jgi:hypothetical protein
MNHTLFKLESICYSVQQKLWSTIHGVDSVGSKIKDRGN